MPYQYKREPLNNDEVDILTNSCSTFREKFVVWTLLDTGLRLSEFAALKKENIQWQERRLVIYGKGGPYGKKNKKTHCLYDRLATTEIYLNLSPEDVIREFLNKW